VADTPSYKQEVGGSIPSSPMSLEAVLRTSWRDGEAQPRGAQLNCGYLGYPGGVMNWIPTSWVRVV
jgi:hypothetical protein